MTINFMRLSDPVFSFKAVVVVIGFTGIRIDSTSSRMTPVFILLPEMRVRDAAVLTGVQNFVVACPKDVTMFRDAVKTTGNESRLQVKDLIEFVHEAL